MVLARTTTPLLKARLMERIEEHERIAAGEAEMTPELELAAAQSRW